jgi:glutamate carboxypeptidase
MKKRKITFTILIVLFSLSVFSQKLNKIEKRIINQVELNNDDALTFLEEVVNINSGTLNIKGVKKVGSIFSNEFKKIGFQTSWKEMPQEIQKILHYQIKYVMSF